MIKYLIYGLLFLFSSTSIAIESSEDELHNELRALLQGLEKAVNEERYSDLSPYFHENMRVTTINQETLSSKAEIKDYFNRWFGPDGYLKKVDMKLVPDAKTEFYANKTIGIVRGYGDENYILSDTRYYEMKTRWTATVIKDNDSNWRILSLHIGTNFLDNPILGEAENALKYFTIGGIITGIVLMFLLTLLVKRFRKK